MERLRLPARIASLDHFREFVDQSARAARAGPEVLLKIELVLEELLVNHVSHAYGSDEGNSEVACFCRPGCFCLELVDEGPPFDPLQQAPQPDLTLAPEERPIGGLGIYMVRSLADEIHYRREADRNVLTVCFALNAPAPAEPTSRAS